MRGAIFLLFILYTVAGVSQNSSKKLDSLDRVNNAVIKAAGKQVTKAYVTLSDRDSIIHLTDNMRKDHRFFGYAKPDLKSERLLLLSIFTNDVEGNPFSCKLGEYYNTSGMKELVLKYQRINGHFVQAVAIGANREVTTVYFEKKWIEIQ